MFGEYFDLTCISDPKLTLDPVAETQNIPVRCKGKGVLISAEYLAKREEQSGYRSVHKMYTFNICTRLET